MIEQTPQQTPQSQLCPALGATSAAAVPSIHADPAGLASGIRAQPSRLWLLDYDGTLTPIVGRPEDARISAQSKANLLALAASPNDTLAIVSGRSIAQLSGFMPELMGARAFFCGLHGGEIVEWPSGQALLSPDPALAQRMSAFTRALTAELDAKGLRGRGILLEDKGYSLAMHFRHADPQSAREALAIFDDQALALRGDFAVRPGKMVVEILPATFDKGSAARLLLDLCAQRQGGRYPHPVCAGDDLTDEHAFAALSAALPGASTIYIGQLSRPTLAQHALPDPEGLHRLIEGVLGPLSAASAPELARS